MHVQVIGAGLGAGAALFLPRRRVRVTIFEQDEMAPPQDTDGCFQNWRRRGVAQAGQPHAYLFRAMNIYAEEAPDFVAAALKAGGRRAPLDFNGSGSADPDGPELFLSRRLVFEAVLRRIVASEPLVTFRLGARVDGSVRRGGEGGGAAHHRRSAGRRRSVTRRSGGRRIGTLLRCLSLAGGGWGSP
jgi:hypothetical protein